MAKRKQFIINILQQLDKIDFENSKIAPGLKLPAYVEVLETSSNCYAVCFGVGGNFGLPDAYINTNEAFTA